MTIRWFLIRTNLNLLHPSLLCAKFGWNWPSGSGGEDFLISSMYFRYFVIISPWERLGPFFWTNLNPLHPRMICAKFGWNWLSGSGEEDFLILSMYFRYLVIISHWEMAIARSFIWTNLNPLQLMMHCAMFGWNWPSGSGEEDFLNFVNVFSLFRNYLHLEKGEALHLNKLESTSLKDALCQVWLNWPSGSGEEDEYVKMLRQQLQRRRQTTDKWALLPSAQVS